MTIADTADAPLALAPARYFFEIGFFAAYAEGLLANDDKPPFVMSDALVDRAWDIVRDASDDPVEFDRYLHRADSADKRLADAEAHYRAFVEDNSDADGSREGLAHCAQALRTYAADLFPANREGKAHFARVLMDAVATTIDAALVRKSPASTFIVWSPDGGGYPTVAHKTHGSAHRAAHALAAKHPGRTFMVMQKSGKRIRRETVA